MTLKEWREKNDLTLEETAKKLSLNYSTFLSYYYGHRKPSAPACLAIEVQTDGEVTLRDFYPEVVRDVTGG